LYKIIKKLRYIHDSSESELFEIFRNRVNLELVLLHYIPYYTPEAISSSLLKP